MLLVFFVAAGDPPPDLNEAHYLCRLKHYWSPDFCRGDLFLESPEAHFTVVWLLGWLTRLVDLTTLAWIGRLLSWAVIAWGWVRIARRVAPYPGVSLLGAALLVVGTEQTHFGGEWIIGGFEAKTLAYGAVLHALVAWLDRRWTLSLALLGGATALHALVGGWSLVALAFAWATQREGRPPLARLLPGLGLAAAIGAAGVLPPLAMNWNTPADIVSEANQIYVFERIAHHLAPLTKPGWWIADRLGRHVGMLLLLAVLHRTLLRVGVLQRRDELQLLARFAWGAAAIAAAGLMVELALWNQPALAAAILKYYWFRLSDIAAPLAGAMILMAGVGAGLASASGGRRAASLGARIGLIGVCAWGVGGHVVSRLDGAFAPADRKTPEPARWAEACTWIRDNLPADALLLTPRLGSSFKWRAERAEVVTWKDVPQDARSMVEWRRRYRDVFLIGVWKSGKPRWTPSLASLGAERLRELGAAYGATHVLSGTPRGDVPGKTRASLPVVRRFGPYTLYALPPPATPLDADRSP
ncbi:MAG: DUF6798 domain-containing protein [Planctomycetota bacterium]